MIDISHVEKQIQKTLSEKIEEELSTTHLSSIIDSLLKKTIEEKVDATITTLLNRLIDSQQISQLVDQQINSEVAEKIDSSIKQTVSRVAAQTDIATVFGQVIQQTVEDRLERAALGNGVLPWKAVQWDGFRLSANSISGGTILKFNSIGIQDLASDVNLTVSDGQVIVEGEMISNHLTVVGNSSVKDLTVSGKLTVKGEVCFVDPGFSQQITGLIKNQIAESTKNLVSDLAGKPLLSNGETLLNNHSLGTGIVESNLRSVGRLKNLTVSGETELGETVYVVGQRVGVNTDEPDGALTVWDQESELTIKKYKNKNMYLGSTRGCNITIGVDNNNSLTVNKTGIETNSIKLGNITISSAKSMPTHSAAPGDIVFNEKASKGEPWCWRCNGNNNWVALYQ